VRGAHPERALEQHVCERVAARPAETLLAAVSGGPDSAALAALLARCAERAGARLVLGHVNHGTRPGAWQDEAVVLALGAALGARVVAASLDPGPAGEARLRAGRYARLIDLARAVGAVRVFTAHHAQDQTETVLLALFRGTGAQGPAGMAPVRPLAAGLSLERPLLGVSRAALAAYCVERHLPYALDPSNDDVAFRRNALRHALEDLRPVFPGLDEAVSRYAEIVRDERSPAERGSLRRELREAIVAATGDGRDVSFERLEAAARALERERPGRHFLRSGLSLEIVRTRRAAESAE
jgi:tRNA(Ile)-lysidine synthase